MKTAKSKKLTWDKIEKSIKNLEPSQLIELVNDLYQLSAENKNFLHARFFDDNAILLRYKEIISNCLYPDVLDYENDFDFDRAKKVIKDYAKATGKEEGITDLMIHYVECGNQFTLDCGDMNEYFYDDLIEMYDKASKAVLKLPQEKQEPFRKRLEKIMRSADGIGWGYYDELCDIYNEVFE